MTVKKIVKGFVTSHKLFMARKFYEDQIIKPLFPFTPSIGEKLQTF